MQSHPYYNTVVWDLPIISIIIRSQFFSLSIGREPTTWPANNCLQIMVCSCAMPSNSVWLQIIFCSCVKETVLFSFLWSLLRENGRSLRFPRILIKKTNSVIEFMIKQLLTSVIAKYCDLSVSRRSIICLSLQLRQIIDLLATDKSRYFAKPRPIIVNYSYRHNPNSVMLTSYCIHVLVSLQFQFAHK